MSFMPMMFRDLMYDDMMMRPSRLLDQHFGVGLNQDDLSEPLSIQSRNMSRGQNYYRPWRTEMARKDMGSTVSADKEKYQISLDVQQFAPNEVTVKTVDDNCVIIEGKHDEKQDEYGWVSRQFMRRYMVPKDYDIKNVTSTMSSDGILNVVTPKNQDMENKNERVIPITHAGSAKAQGSGDNQNADK